VTLPAVLALRGGADAAAVSGSAWLRVLLRMVFPGNPQRVRADIAPPPPPPAPPAAAKGGSKGFTAKGVTQRKGGTARPAKAGSVVAVHSKAEFDKQMASAKSSQLVVVDFFATWCGPCQQIAPKYAAMAGDLTQAKFLKVDVDECKEVSQQYGVTAMPTFKMFRGGVEVATMQGADEGALRAKIESLAGKPDRWASAGGGRKL
jgi:thioredoxin